MSAISSFLSAVIILILCLTLATEVYVRTDRWLTTDACLRFGLSGLVALGSLGTFCLFVGLFSVNAIVYLFGALVIIRALFFRKEPIGWKLYRQIRDAFKGNGPRGNEWVFLSAIKLCEIIVLIGVLAPPDTQEWDSLAYHLAVPKLWMAQGHITYVPYIHQSNFPGAFDYLYLIGLLFGSAGAKAFVYAAAKFGGFAIFGLTRQLYGRKAAWWATLTYATVPVILWLSGTAYIDVPNGLCAGLGIALAALYCKTLQKEHLWMAAVMLGLATASKYTGLQTIGAVGFMLLIVGIKRKQGGEFFKSAVLMGLIALVIACPWYVKNVVNTGNPVYPFFYSKLGGHDWSAPQAEQYSREQSSFGVGRNAAGVLDKSQIGHAVLGLAYQPGRYINPAQQFGGGSPLGAVGVVILCSLMAWALSGRSQQFEMFCLGAIGISLLMWFLLSQQSRYIVTLGVPLAIMLGGGVVRLRSGTWLACISALQAIYSVGLVYKLRTSDQIPVALGIEGRTEYVMRRVDFADAATFINQNVPKTGRVALYDVVFGYDLDVPYYWANPGHSNEIPYPTMRNGHDYIEALRKMGFTHVYVKLSRDVRPEEENRAWVDAMGLQGLAQPFPESLRGKYNFQNFEQSYVPLIADASAHGELQPVQAFRTGILFKIAPQ